MVDEKQDGPRRQEDAEARLDALRSEAATRGRVSGEGVRAVAGPLPTAIDYSQHPILKPPVWTWEVPLYLFLGGLSGMAAVVAMAAWGGAASPVLVRDALRLAVLGAALCPLLLISDLGRPARFLNMLRVFKRRSPMSVGAWTLVLFGLLVVPTWALVEGYDFALELLGDGARIAVQALLLPSALAGALLAVYTGVLLAATVIPAWNVHRALLPVHFGVAGLGSASAALELLGHGQPALWRLGLAAAAIETALTAWLALARRHEPADRAVRHGRPGVLVGLAGGLAGPVSLVLRVLGQVPYAATAFLVGAVLSRFGWLAAGRGSAGTEPGRFN